MYNTMEFKSFALISVPLTGLSSITIFRDHDNDTDELRKYWSRYQKNFDRDTDTNQDRK